MQLLTGRTCRTVAVCLCLFTAFVALALWHTCVRNVCNLQHLHLLFSNKTPTTYYWGKLKSSKIHIKKEVDDLVSDLVRYPTTTSDNSYDKLSVGLSEFDVNANDVIVFLHIQNTGGSVFARHLVEDLSLESPCICKANRRLCHCYRPNKFGSSWLFSRYTNGWKCGVHPDWAELSNCVDRVMDEEEGHPVKRRYFFITMLRDPMKRFFSEFWHVRQEQSWPAFHSWCDDYESSCLEGNELRNLSLDNFLDCTYNPAVNRQTRMLSDMSLVGCYNSSSSQEDKDLIMFTSAKANLHKMSFFGLAEFPKISQYMFEVTFNLYFKIKGKPSRSSLFRSARKELFKGLTAKQIEKIKRANSLDIELYDYAKELLFYRFEKLKHKDPQFENNFQTVGNNKLLIENWAEREDFFDTSNR